MEYSILQQTSTKKLKIRKLIHALLLGVISVETLRYAAAVQLWPGTFKDLLEKLNEDALYFSITIPASNMFWSKCLIKLLQIKTDRTHIDSYGDPTYVASINKKESEQWKQFHAKIRFIAVLAFCLVGVMYGIDVLDTSKSMNTKCTYGIFRVILPLVVGSAIIGVLIVKESSAVADIEFHGIGKH
ncbi:unnamed protein product, partial [Didymodactylos carnosus]